ncbi:MAG: polyamine ABC transporter substrate-binding protein [Gammaproteobacteria bacterium]|nr:polyamine ABC transporter substrate-binding protein [Gammaproteobacteria bacterium]
MNTKSKLGFGLAAVALSVSGALSAADGKQLHIYSWSDYIAEDTVKNFEKETGIKVTYDVYDSNEVLQGKLSAGNTGYDIVVPTTNFLGKQIEAKTHMKLDKSKLPNLKNLDPGAMKRLEAVDPGNQYAVPYLWGTIGIGINVDKVKKALGENVALDSWDLLFKEENIKKLAECGVAFLDSPSEVFPNVLHYLGKEPNSLNDKDYTGAAQELLLKIRPHIRKFHSSEYISNLADGEICAAYGYSGDVGIAASRAEEAKNGVKIQYIIPKEGTAIWFDSMVIPADSKNVEAAHQWIDFILRPDVIAGISNFVTYPNPNPESTKLVDKALTEDPVVYPPQDVMDKMFTIAPKPAKTDRAMTRVWTKVKTGH